MLHKDLLTLLSQAREMLRVMGECSPSVQEIADELGISLYHFIRLFKAVFGETPNQYQIRMKLDRAKHLLATSDCSVTEVCMEVGYSSLGTFSDLFSRRVGMTPSSYREKLRSSAPTPDQVRKQLVPGCFSLMCASSE